MKIKALQDFSYFYKGILTLVKSGEVLEVEDRIASEFIESKLASKFVESKIAKEVKDNGFNKIASLAEEVY